MADEDIRDTASNESEGYGEEGFDSFLDELLTPLVGQEDDVQQPGEEYDEYEEDEGKGAGEEEEHEEEPDAGDAEEALNEDELRMYGIDGLDPETQRQLLPYLRKISANFNRLHQKTVERLKEYEALGTPEDVMNALSLLAAASEDPQGFLEAMLNEGLFTDEDVIELTSEEEEEPEVDEELAERIAESLASQIEELKAEVGEFDERMLIPFIDPSTLDIREAYTRMVAEAYRVSRTLVTPLPDVRYASSAAGEPKKAPKTLDEAAQAALEFLKEQT